MLSTFSMTKFKGANKVLRNCEQTRKAQKSGEILFKPSKRTSPTHAFILRLCIIKSFQRLRFHIYVRRKHWLTNKPTFQLLHPPPWLWWMRGRSVGWQALHSSDSCPQFWGLPTSLQDLRAAHGDDQCRQKGLTDGWQVSRRVKKMVTTSSSACLVIEL